MSSVMKCAHRGFHYSAQIPLCVQTVINSYFRWLFHEHGINEIAARVAKDYIELNRKIVRDFYRRTWGNLRYVRAYPFSEIFQCLLCEKQNIFILNSL